MTDTDLSIYDPPFMSVQFPDKIDPWRSARSRLDLNGDLAAGVFARIPEPGRLIGPVRVRLKFSAPDAKRVKIDLWLQAKIAWICQRCLDPVQWPQTVSRTLLVMEPVTGRGYGAGAGEPGTGDELEAITVARGELLSLNGLIEDELLLALPFAPMHKHCEQNSAVADARQHETKNNPFAALAGLRVRKTTD